MISPKELFKKWHPEQFSDSQIVKKGKMDRAFLDYYLSTLSSKSLEKDFEGFCKRLIESEICPNLLPQTGPTGGGDSKVDSETYPVSEQLTEAWYYGEGNIAGSERWAFAFSIKKDWKSKVKSDVKKIVETNRLGRNYTKIFFVSNQDISDKKRAEAEDQLRAEQNIDVRILDKNWIVDKVFSRRNNMEILCESLKISQELLDERIVGELDYKREKQLEEIENRLKDLQKLKTSEILSNVKESIILSRQLEVDYQKILGLLERYKRLVNKYGTTIDTANAYYECAWTMFWWYGDDESFYSYYLLLEEVVLKEKSPHLFEKLVTLFTILHNFKPKTTRLIIDLAKHKKVLDEIYVELSSDKSRPNRAKSAKLAYQSIRLLYGEQIDNIVSTYIEILQDSQYSLDINISQISEYITRIPIFQEAKRYEELFELLLKRISKEEEKSVASLMLAQHGHSFVEVDPYKAISFFSRALLGFYTETNTAFLMQVLVEIAACFEKIGLYWAARNYYYYVLTYCIAQYLNKGEVSPFFFVSAFQLKWLELQQGRILYSTEMSLLERIGSALYPKKIDEKDDHYEMFLAYPLFQSPFEKIIKLRKFPAYLEKTDLYLAAVVCRYELGVYDDKMLEYNNGSKDEYDKFMKEWCNKETDLQIRYTPWYGFEKDVELKSRVMGCEFIVHSENRPFSIEFATSLLASIECLLGTGFSKGLITLVNRFEIEISSVKGDTFTIDIDYSRKKPTYLGIIICEEGFRDLLTAQEVYSEKTIKIISIIVSVLLSSKEDFDKLKKLVDSDDIIIRTRLFADSLFNGYTFFGAQAFSYDYLTSGLEEEMLQRSSKVQLYTAETKVEEEFVEKRIIYDSPPEFEFDRNKIGNDRIVSDDIINVPLWNISGWRGIVYICIPNGPLGISFLFENEAGLNIFQEWLDNIGQFDKKDLIALRIIEGIDEKNPYSYRVSVGSSLNNSVKDVERRLFISKNRLHTMTPINDINLRNFKECFKNVKEFFICPSLIRKNNSEPDVHLEKRIIKNSKSLKIMKAYEISENDILSEMAILPFDRPIIPFDKRGCYLEKIIKRKSKYKKK